MFKITQGKGVNIKFENGWSISIQWGPGNYCHARQDGFLDAPEDTETWFAAVGEHGSLTAEIAVRNPNGGMIGLEGVPHCGEDSVKGWLTPNQVLDIMNWVVARKPA
jgi:hypothetical protein